MKILERSFSNAVNVSAAVAKWNHWDHEHVTHIHASYTDAKVLFENTTTVVYINRWRLPFLPFLQSGSLGIAIATEEYTLKDYRTTYFGIPVEAIITIEPTGKDTCTVHSSYKFILKGWKHLLAWPMNFMMENWNEKIWLEDLPMKLRRQKVLRHGFKDFIGLPDKISDRVEQSGLRQELPIPRPKGSDIDLYLKLLS